MLQHFRDRQQKFSVASDEVERADPIPLRSRERPCHRGEDGRAGNARHDRDQSRNVLANLSQPELPAAASEHSAKQGPGLRGSAVQHHLVPGWIGLREPSERHACPGASGGVAAEVITNVQHLVAANVKSLAGLAEKRPGSLPQPHIS